MKNNLQLASILNILLLCIIIAIVSAYFIYNIKSIGYILVGLALLCLASLRFFKMKISLIKPDIMFGIIDNGILAVMTIFGGKIAGVAGAVIGGVVGNAITDGIAGIFEGYWAEKSQSDHRTVLGSAVGKMAGCLLGAGVVLIIASFF